MREGWEIRAFDACIEKRKAPTKLLSSLYQEKGLYPIVSQEKDLISGYWDNQEDLFVHRKPVVVFGDHTMVVKFIDFDFVVGADGVKILEPKEFLLPKFFFYWVSSVHIKSRGYARHFRYLREASVPVPSLPEQQRIVDILDQEFAKIDALKANAEKSLQAAKDLFQATLKKELEPKEGWEELAIPEVSENLDSKRVPITKSVRDSGQYPYYGASGIVDYVADYIFDEPLLLVSEDGANLLARSTPIAFSIAGKVWVNNHAHVLRFDDPKKQKFVEYWFAGNDISSLITGAAQPKFNQKALNSVKMAFPTKEQEMEAILDRLGEMEEKSNSLQDNYQKTLSLCDDLKQALLRKAFNGVL